MRPKRVARMRSYGVGDAAALDVAEDGHARLEAGRLLDLLAEPVADAALREQLVAELVDLALFLGSRELAALADDDDREVLAARVPAADLARDLVEVDRPLGDQDHVGAAGDAAVHRDPAGVPAHHLDDHDAVVRLGRRVEPVDRLGADRDGGVEAERVVGAREVVVDRLRDADDGELELAVERAQRRRGCPRRRSRRARRAARTSVRTCRRHRRPCTGSCSTCR